MEIDHASSADEALALLEKHPHDVIISDYRMSGKDGLELLEELRTEGNDIPFIMFTDDRDGELRLEVCNPEVE